MLDLENIRKEKIRHLRKAGITNADLRDADLTNACLISADFNGANLTDANLINTNLKNADLRGADFHKAYLDKTNLVGAILDYSSLPLSCRGIRVILDENLINQHLFHLLVYVKTSNNPKLQKLLLTKPLIEQANQFKRKGLTPILK